MGNSFNKQKTEVSYTKVIPTNNSNSYQSSAPNAQTHASYGQNTSTAITTTSGQGISSTSDRSRDVVQVKTEVATREGFKPVTFNIDHDAFVRIFMDPKVELGIGNLAYLIGYKMVYVVDEYRQRIPNVIAIVTLKINAQNNIIFQSEKSRGHHKKEVYELLKLSNSIAKDSYYSRDSQADSLRHTGGNMLAWEHSTKYCAHNVETLALTFCGKFRDVITACKKYDANLAFAESAYTFEENMEPVVYEVGHCNHSKYVNPNIGSGGCLDFFHFFLRPEYAIDYGFWQFQFNDKRSDVNRTEIVLGKRFADLRKVNYIECAGDVSCDRGNVKLVKDKNGYTSSQLFVNRQRDEIINRQTETEVESVVGQLEKEIETEAKLASSPPKEVDFLTGFTSAPAPTTASEQVPTQTSVHEPTLTAGSVPVSTEHSIVASAFTFDAPQPVSSISTNAVPMTVLGTMPVAMPVPYQQPQYTVGQPVASVNVPYQQQTQYSAYTGQTVGSVNSSYQPYYGDQTGLRYRGHDQHHSS
ncbi:hypothetical protein YASMINEVIRUS_1466 [Yasminevirus sp. GU-2018]|uniref:Uncharacterized protein n=1 Tax=Yasminevirus sp. GU-2018 TaxID=2420051 RepID=A0A5K0UBM5_9VIRU|nr:hypothetical protein YASMINEVIRUS_1466 [Yasminevirus sp. GU-2018]